MRDWRRWGSGFVLASLIDFRQAVSARSAAWRPRNLRATSGRQPRIAVLVSENSVYSHSTALTRISLCISLFMNGGRNPYPICISGDASDRGDTVM
ncbi:hypothetical protein PR003_g27101 [Phytophthora rubi]|uniref:Secreted protein n=1 Tax=Phytophthora rubi TaxID=129364 RepID=A0A6A4C401_9STRA|nr:hypothetical protein PR001_g25862 [Phytophthora rubi]KAE9044273.1 hypothetical protein PR002_g2890 [Phytophthora rubi]KAE9283559.1 hypothetical protein PR003_g27101 [Phytophthora rubi]